MNDLGHTIDIIRRANDMAAMAINLASAGALPKREWPSVYRVYAMSSKKFIEAITRQYSVSKQLPRLPRSSKQVEHFARKNKMTSYQGRLLMQRYPELKPWMDQVEGKLKCTRRITK